MEVNSHNIEFGYELLSAVPFAYEKHLSGELTETMSGTGSGALYYFSPNHRINSKPRSWFHTKEARTNGLPYTLIHQPELQPKAFPPYLEYYANDQYKWQKPTLVICNRFNNEWGRPPINYFDHDILDWLFSNLKDQYQIVYFPVKIPVELQDNNKPLKFDDRYILAKHPEVINFTDIIQHSWNESMFKVFANCQHYITMNGGYSIAACFFKGTNIIYSKPGKPQSQEIAIHSFDRWYSNINNVRTLHVPDYEQLKRKVQALYIDHLPTVNVLIRTNNRPNFLADCMKSVYSQDYANMNPILICDSQPAVEYTRKYKCRMVQVKAVDRPKAQPTGKAYGDFFPWNEYIDQVQKLCTGYILVLDDDDWFTHPEAVTQIIEKADPAKVNIWRVKMHNKVIPSASWGKEVRQYDVTAIGTMYHTDHIRHTDWSPWKMGDFRTAHKLAKAIGVNWIEGEPYTAIQTEPGRGNRLDKPAAKHPGYIEVIIKENGRNRKTFLTESELKTFEQIIKNRGAEICII